MGKTSIIPPKDKLIAEFRKHLREYDWLLSEGYLDGRLSKEGHDNFYYQKTEMDTIGKVLDALHPGWSKKV